MLGAYYQCFRNKISFERAIESYRKYYPTGSLIVLNDGGDNFNDIVLKNRGIYFHKLKINTEKNLIFKNKISLIEFLLRFWEHINLIVEPYFILLEDDVRVLKRHSIPFQYTINGCNTNELLPIQLQNILYESGYRGQMFYGACGGSVLDTFFFKKISFESVKNLINILPEFPYASDQIISFIVLYFGGTIGEYSEFAEMWYPNIEILLNNNNVSFLHQYKNDYDTI